MGSRENKRRSGAAVGPDRTAVGFESVRRRWGVDLLPVPQVPTAGRRYSVGRSRASLSLWTKWHRECDVAGTSPEKERKGYRVGPVCSDPVRRKAQPELNDSPTRCFDLSLSLCF